MCSKSCTWFLGILSFVLLGCCCCMGMKLGKYAAKCGRCVFFGNKDEGCEEYKQSVEATDNRMGTDETAKQADEQVKQPVF